MISVAARHDLYIEPGDKLLVFGDLDQGFARGTVDLIRKTVHTFLPEWCPPLEKRPSLKKRAVMIRQARLDPDNRPR